MPAPHRLRILHLSDLHERVLLDGMSEERKARIELTEVDRRIVLDESNFLDVLRNEIGKVDLLCFTGDAADWGFPGEFAKAGERLRRIMDATGTSADRLYIVPGNHDVQRKVAAEAWSGLRTLGYGSAVVREISDWMAGFGSVRGGDAAWRDAIATRTAAFWQWVDGGLGRGALLPSRSPHKRLGYRVEVPGLDLPFKVHILGFDTAWLCGDDSDKGNIYLTSGQVKRLARDTGTPHPLTGFRLALMHHPLAELADGKECFSLLAPCADLLLHGHQHDPIAETLTNPDRQLIVLATGSLYADEAERWINSFHVIDAWLDDHGRPLTYDVTFWGWSDRGHWHRTGAIYEQAKDGVLKLDARRKGAAAPGAADRAPAAARTVPRELEPAYFVPRPAEHARIKALLLDTGKSRPLAIVGMPGVGKSTLAAALARDDDIVQRFERRILWATLGADDPRVATHLGRFLSALGNPGQAESAIEPARDRLAELLATTPALIVLDDVWNAEAAKPFLDALGPRSVLLMTTRDSGIAEESDAHPVDLPPMSPSESMALIEQLLDQPIADIDRAAVAAVAAEGGHLPLALWLVCARIREGDSWKDLWAKLADEQARLRALEPAVADNSLGKNRSLVAAFNLSITALDERTRERFGLISLLAENTSFTPAVAATVWATTGRDAELTLRILQQKGLILGAVLSDGTRGFRLHDEQRNAARRDLGPAHPHRRLLDIYRRHTPNGWAGAIDDGYLFDHLAEHLVHAGHADELGALLAQESHDGRNAWFVARQQQLDRWLADLEVAAAAPGAGAADQARYAMMASSVSSLASNLPGGVARALVEHGLWPPERALAWALSSPPTERLNNLAALATILDDPLRNRTIDAALAVIREAPEDKELGQAWKFSNLPIDLPESARTKALELAKGTRVKRATTVIVTLAAFAKAGHFDIVRREVEALGNLNRSDLAYLVPHLPVEQLPWVERDLDSQDGLRGEIAVRWLELGEPLRALEHLRKMSEKYQTSTIVRTADQWDVGALRDIEAVADAMQAGPERTQAQLAVWAQLDEPARSERYRAFCDELCRGADWVGRDALRLALPHMPRVAVEMLVNDRRVRDVLDERTTWALAARVGQLGDADSMWTLLGAKVDRDSARRVAPFLAEQHLIQAGVTNEACDPSLLWHLLPRWAELGHDHDAVAALARLRTSPALHTLTASWMAPHLGSVALDLARAACERIADRPAQAGFLLSLAAQAPDALAECLFDFDIEIAAHPQVLHALARKASRELARRLHAHLRHPLLRLAVASTQDATAPDQLIDDLTAAQAFLSDRIGDARNSPMDEKVAGYRGTGSLWLFAKALDVVPRSHRAKLLAIGCDALDGNAFSVLGAPRIYVRFRSGEDLADAVLRADHLQHPYNVGRLADVAAALAGDSRERTQIEGLILRLLGQCTKDEVLLELSSADMLTPFLATHALGIADELQRRRGYLIWGGPELAAHLARMGRVDDAIRVAGLTEKLEEHHTDSLVALARHLPAPRHRDYLEEAWRRLTPSSRETRIDADADAIGGLATRATREPKPFVEKLWRRASLFLAAEQRPDLWKYLGAMAPLLMTLAGPAGIRKTWDAARDVARWWP